MTYVEPLITIFTGGYTVLRPDVYILIVSSFLFTLYLRTFDSRIKGSLGELSNLFIAFGLAYGYVLISAFVLLPIFTHLKFFPIQGVDLMSGLVFFATLLAFLDFVYFRDSKGVIVKWKEDNEKDLEPIDAFRILIAKSAFPGIVVAFVVLMIIWTGFTEPDYYFLVNWLEMSEFRPGLRIHLYYFGYWILTVLYYAIALGIWEVMMLATNNIFEIHEEKIIDQWIPSRLYKLTDWRDLIDRSK